MATAPQALGKSTTSHLAAPSATRCTGDVLRAESATPVSPPASRLRGRLKTAPPARSWPEEGGAGPGHSGRRAGRLTLHTGWALCGRGGHPPRQKAARPKPAAIPSGPVGILGL